MLQDKFIVPASIQFYGVIKAKTKKEAEISFQKSINNHKTDIEQFVMKLYNDDIRTKGNDKKSNSDE